MADQVDKAKVEAIGLILVDPKRPLKERFRALFTLRNIGGQTAIDCIAKCFSDPSELLKHECGYCLGQMRDTYANPHLVTVLTDTNQQPIVRHEAAEALGAIGSPDVLDLLKKHSTDPVIEVAETCQLAARRIEWLQNQENNSEELPDNPYLSTDPAPPETVDKTDVPQLKETLLNQSVPLFERYRAMFSLRNLGTNESVLALAEGLNSGGALFRHEIAYVLGQMQHEASVKQLSISLKDLNEHPMVRHECAEALGSIATQDCTDVLQEYLKDEHRVVKESCVVALDMCDYAQTDEFNYADTLMKMQDSSS